MYKAYSLISIENKQKTQKAYQMLQEQIVQKVSLHKKKHKKQQQ